MLHMECRVSSLVSWGAGGLCRHYCHGVMGVYVNTSVMGCWGSMSSLESWGVGGLCYH